MIPTYKLPLSRISSVLWLIIQLSHHFSARGNRTNATKTLWKYIVAKSRPQKEDERDALSVRYGAVKYLLTAQEERFRLETKYSVPQLKHFILWPFASRFLVNTRDVFNSSKFWFYWVENVLKVENALKGMTLRGWSIIYGFSHGNLKFENCHGNLKFENFVNSIHVKRKLGR